MSYEIVQRQKRGKGGLDGSGLVSRALLLAVLWSGNGGALLSAWRIMRYLAVT